MRRRQRRRNGGRYGGECVGREGVAVKTFLQQTDGRLTPTKLSTGQNRDGGMGFGRKWGREMNLSSTFSSPLHNLSLTFAASFISHHTSPSFQPLSVCLSFLYLSLGLLSISPFGSLFFVADLSEVTIFHPYFVSFSFFAFIHLSLPHLPFSLSVKLSPAPGASKQARFEYIYQRKRRREEN